MDPISPINTVPENPIPSPAADAPDRRFQKKEDRRKGDRRVMTAEESGYTGPDRRQSVVDQRTGLERRRGPGIRRAEHTKDADEGEFSPEQLEFVMAVETYKKVNKRMFPTWTEVFHVIHQLGYRKVEARSVNLDVPEPELYKLSA
jgi:hypothetical protein